MVVVLYIGKGGDAALDKRCMSDRIAAGFLTTFTMLARDRLSIKAMAHLLVKVFFGYGGEIIPVVTAILF